jgi:hypothetical protein
MLKAGPWQTYFLADLKNTQVFRPIKNKKTCQILTGPFLDFKLKSQLLKKAYVL